MKNPSPRDAYRMGFMHGVKSGKPGLPQGSKSFPRGIMFWADGEPVAAPETIRQDGIACLEVALSADWEKIPVDRVLALPNLEDLLAEFARGYADGEDDDAEALARSAADPGWRGWRSDSERPTYRPDGASTAA